MQNTNTCFSACGTSSTCLHSVNQLFPMRWMANQRPHSKAEELERRCLSSVPWKKGISHKTEAVLFSEGLYLQKYKPQEIKRSVKGHLGNTNKNAAETCAKVRMGTAAPPELHPSPGLERGAVQGLHSCGWEHKHRRAPGLQTAMAVQVYIWALLWAPQGKDHPPAPCSISPSGREVTEKQSWEKRNR